MINPEYLTADIEAIFTRIQNEQMKGVPILNYAIQVEAVGFQEWQGCCVGVLITPWFMNLMLFPGPGEAWEELAVGTKQRHEFPAGSHELTINEFDQISRCQSYPIHSPMHAFVTHEDARSAARTFIDVLMANAVAGPVDDDEVPFERFLQGDEMAQIYREEQEAKAACQCPSLKEQVERKVSRRDLLRGNLQG